MTLLVPRSGEAFALSYFVGKTASTESLRYKLFATNITPSETDTAATYTEAAGGGYADILLTAANWTVTQGAPSSAAYAQQSYTFTGPLTTNLTIYGYYAVRATTLDLALAEAFSSFTPSNNGDKILLTPQITAD
jgi:hypothetical protein